MCYYLYTIDIIIIHKTLLHQNQYVIYIHINKKQNLTTILTRYITTIYIDKY